MDVAALLDSYKVDQAHARKVADLALALYDAVAGRYDLPQRQRRLLEVGGLLHNVGLTTDPPAHHLVGRDIVLRHPIAGLSPRERALVACMVAFHRKKVRPELEPAYLALGKQARREARQLAAILRVADGLDYSQSQSTDLVALEPLEGALLLRLAGPHAAGDGARAVAKADLWARVFDEPLRAEGDGAGPTSAAGEPGEDEAPILAPWYAAPDAPLAELGRVLLRRHLRRLLAAERGVRADKGIEQVHNLRVATRRLRATLRLLAPVYAGPDLRAHGKAVGKTARAAGAVRDRDVLLADLEARADALPEQLAPSIAALAETLRAERRAAHADLVAYLDGDRHAAFLRAFARAMNDPGCWDDRPRVRDLGGSTLWRHYEALRAHDRCGLPADEEELHMMRIDGKRMRYVLELFADTLGPRADQAVQPLIAFQDHMGGLNDIAVARQLLAPHAAHGAAGPAVAAYLALREQEGARLRDELPARWEQLGGDAYRRGLMELIVAL
ncbi:MAG TPA: CHAD domain-containing protein [Chloroflexaceae bacterium]|nr:CHAD domain-containing protein [Chloroflexaceae bacterium]